MKTNMTDKDKRLLVGMFMFVIIVAIGYWGVIPQIKAISDLETKIESEEDDQKINKLKISNAALIEMQVEEYTDKLNEVKDNFYPKLTSANVDQMFTEMATKKGLNIYELKFSMPTSPSDRLAYIYSPLNQTQLEQMDEYQQLMDAAEATGNKTKSDDDSASDKEDSDKETDKTKSNSKNAASELSQSIMGAEEGSYQPNTDIYAVPVAITVGGEVSQLEEFLDEMNHLDKMSLVTGFTWGDYRTYVKRDANGNIISSDNTATATGDGVTLEQLEEDTTVRKSLTIQMEIYMCDTESLLNTAEDDAEETEETTSDSENSTEKE